MALHIIVTAKQVSDPEMPISAYSIDAAGPRVVTPARRCTRCQPTAERFSSLESTPDVAATTCSPSPTTRW